MYPKWFSAILYTSVAFMFVNSRGKCTAVKQAELEFSLAWEVTGLWMEDRGACKITGF